MSKFKFPKNNVYYVNMPEAESVRSPLLFSIPRICGHEHRLPQDRYGVNVAIRPPPARAMFKYTLDGRGELRIGGRTVPLLPGHAFCLMVPGDCGYRLPPDSEKWEFLWFSFWHPSAVAILEKIIEENGNVFSLNPDGAALRKAWFLYDIFKNGEFADKYSMALTGFDFLMQLCREASPFGAKPEKNEILHKVSSYCFRCLSVPVTVDDLAAHCGYSRWHFAKLFRKAAGMPPSKYISEMKLNASLRLIQETGGDIKKVADSCGFSDQGYFARLFRRRFGMPPSKFLQSEAQHQDFWHDR